ERRVFVVRKRVEREVEGVYFPSLSTRTLVYKGMLTAPQLRRFYPDLADPRLTSALALVHSRFSTNTFPSWPLAHPFRVIAHNGEINTVRGNRGWMRAREALLASEDLPGLARAMPVLTPGASDSASFDEVVELLTLAGRSLPHALCMMVPEAWEHDDTMSPARRAFFQYHACLMEPWDGPAAIGFTDGTIAGAVVDRNGLRPARWWRTDDGLLVLASEVGVLDIAPERVVEKGALQPGRMLLVDTATGRLVPDEEIKAELAAAAPYQAWLDAGLLRLDELAPTVEPPAAGAAAIRDQVLFGYGDEDLRVVLGPMAATGAEPVGSMGSDTPPAVLSTRPRLLFDYFTQGFAQVTNPPLDSLWEELVTSVGGTLGPEGNLLAPGPESCRQVAVPYPVLTGAELARLRALPDHPGGPRLRAVVIDGLFPASEGGEGLRRALVEVGARASAAIASGAGILVLSDRRHTAELAPIPSLLLTAAVHHHLVQQRTRTRVALVVEAGDAREVHHLALLLGYGAGAVHPYLALQSVAELAAAGDLEEVLASQAVRNYVQAVGKGVLKVMSKMGISTLASYTGAQVFEVLGLADAVVDAYFSGTPSRLGGVGLDVLAAEVVARHRAAYLTAPAGAPAGLGPGAGEYQWRRDGEVHLFDPETVFRLQHATRARRRDIFRAYTQRVDHPTGGLITLRSLLRLRVGERPPVPLEEVEPAASIMRRFATGAMSYGSISAEAHETLAVAMNRLGARSNSGEGGEDPERDRADPGGDSRRSRIRQVASARFGVTSSYLVGADDLQIKIAQGAKPGEGGQLPGHKVYPWIARTRHSVPGVGLISPAPHHDIYSIEDLAQLVLDLKSANPRARVHVKLVSQVGVGTVAAGVAKARADVILISGGDGGTGAAPLTSLKHAGAPWELGLAETQQTLLANGLRDRVTVQVDGQLRTGRDVVVAALLGAEEYGFATAALVVSGCVMMRVCHLNTCPVGIATQDPELRRLFTGRPEFVQTFFEYVAEEVREHLAALGLRTLDEAVGRVELLEAVPAVGHWKASSLDLSALLARPSLPADAPRRRVTGQDHQLAGAFDERLMERCRPALERGDPVELTLPVTNADRAVGTRLGHEVTRRHGAAGLPADTLRIHCRGSAGQSFGAFLPPGITLLLEGDANDYVGKGLSGGRLVLRPPPQAPFAAEANVIAGNVALYGATAGELFVCGRMGERFAVRNSGATAVVEGVGNHGCEYMTGGRVVVLGPTGRNFAAGMSGGAAFVLDADGTFAKRCNIGLVTLEAPAAEDASWLRAVLERHHALTGSPVAARVLAAGLGRMVKVMPTELQRLLRAEAATLAAAADG
ncbi:MAG TPA: glutamate synthase large subunit, partial [Candidatus Dormibacteraeota bacterium]|nr:glutamate synthase large subunit [Candidatus Dormibacteraeota bacterium]